LQIWFEAFFYIVIASLGQESGLTPAGVHFFIRFSLKKVFITYKKLSVSVIPAQAGIHFGHTDPRINYSDRDSLLQSDLFSIDDAIFSFFSLIKGVVCMWMIFGFCHSCAGRNPF
jgi:hypothetical protein